MFRDRSFWAFFTGILFLGVFGLVRPDSPDPLENVNAAASLFYLQKTHQDSRYDGVILGDSRAVRGFSPAAISESLLDVEIFNFAFYSGGLNPEMYREAELLFNNGTKKKLVILAITPLVFFEYKTSNAQFREYREKARDIVYFHKKFPRAVEFFRSMKPSVFIRNIFSITPQLMYHQDFHDDGWIASRTTPFRPFDAIEAYKTMMSDQRVSPRLLAELFSQTRTWVDAGIAVFAVRPPTTDAMFALEADLFNFDEEAFIRDVIAAGGHWIPVSADTYETYDGSHLVEDSAVRFSQYLGREIAHVMAED